MELAIQQSPQQKAEMWEAHLIRTRDRIAQFRDKLEVGVSTPGERVLIESEIQKLEGQLTPPTDGRIEEASSASPSIVQQLKAEIRSLAAIVKELMGKSSVTPDAG